jgi:hypothetical protein
VVVCWARCLRDACRSDRDQSFRRRSFRCRCRRRAIAGAGSIKRTSSRVRCAQRSISMCGPISSYGSAILRSKRASGRRIDGVMCAARSPCADLCPRATSPSSMTSLPRAARPMRSPRCCSGAARPRSKCGRFHSHVREVVEERSRERPQKRMDDLVPGVGVFRSSWRCVRAPHTSFLRSFAALHFRGYANRYSSAIPMNTDIPK